MADGLRRERNLMAFRSFTVSFEATGSRALPQLLWYLQELQVGGGQLPLPKAASENAVTLMTIHSSKGLEFPVVFLSDLSHQFNLRDMQDAILMDNDLAVGCNRVDHNRFVRYPTLAKKAIVHKKTREAVSEELRVLYVAMTRARERLIMTYYSRSLLSELKQINMQLSDPVSDYLCASARNPGKWILAAALCRTEAGELFAQVGPNGLSRVHDTVWKIVYRDLCGGSEERAMQDTEPAVTAPSVDPAAVRLLQYSYPHRDACDVPGKLTATQLKGRNLDQEAADGAQELPRVAAYRFRQPTFLRKRLTAAEQGTATHLFLQFANYEACSSADGLQAEVERLLDQAYLTREQADAVQQDQILRFFASELGIWLLNSSVRREFKFSLLVDAGEFGLSAQGEQVMLQGVVDCFVAEEDGLTILDFKTDRSPNPEYYRPQLEAYGQALSRIYRLPVKRKLLYFFATGELIEL
jgi:ATP-dependent helicase/nuclease subunit A